MALWGDRTGFDMTVFAGGGSIWFGEILKNLSNSIYADDAVC